MGGWGLEALGVGRGGLAWGGGGWGLAALGVGGGGRKNGGRGTAGFFGGAEGAEEDYGNPKATRWVSEGGWRGLQGGREKSEGTSCGHRQPRMAGGRAGP